MLNLDQSPCDLCDVVGISLSSISESHSIAMHALASYVVVGILLSSISESHLVAKHVKGCNVWVVISVTITSHYYEFVLLVAPF